MKKKIFFLLSSFVISCTPTESEITNYYKTSAQLYKDTKDRPDLMVRAYKQNPHLWINDPKIKLYFSEALHKTGNYKQSNALGLELLLEKLHYFQRGRLYLTLARNYEALGHNRLARFYYNKTLRYNNYFYLYRYAQFEHIQKNLLRSLKLYEKSLSIKRVPYIVNSYHKVLEDALISYRDTKFFDTLKKKAISAEHFNKHRILVIEKAIIIKSPNFKI